MGRLNQGGDVDSFQCDIIVLTWNHLELTKQFFESLLFNTFLKVRIIAIDNGSIDGTPGYLRELKERLADKLEVIFNKENMGFVKGVNQGLSVSTAPYVCFANNDLIFTKGWLDEMISLFERNKLIGILNPNSNNLGMHISGKESIESLAIVLKNRYKGIFTEMPFCIGFCMVMRRDIIDKSKGLSEDYAPMFFEDSDISMKAKEMGYLIGVAKGAYVWHKEHGSFNEGSESDNIFKRSQRIFQKKWGKTLRIAWVEDEFIDLLNDLRQSIKFITFYIKNIDVLREDVFKSLNTFEHSAVQFKKFRSYFGLVWGILVKKKQFDLVISKEKFLRFILSALGKRVVSEVNDILITDIKKVN
jgi:GT2 family glycosyltransferase